MPYSFSDFIPFFGGLVLLGKHVVAMVFANTKAFIHWLYSFLWGIFSSPTFWLQITIQFLTFLLVLAFVFKRGEQSRRKLSMKIRQTLMLTSKNRTI